MTYRYCPETGTLTFTDGVKYTIDEAVQLSKGKLSDDDLMAIHQIKKMFDGEIENIFRRDPLPEHVGEVPGPVSIPDMRTVLQKRPVYGRRKPREVFYDNPDQGVLDL